MMKSENEPKKISERRKLREGSSKRKERSSLQSKRPEAVMRLQERLWEMIQTSITAPMNLLRRVSMNELPVSKLLGVWLKSSVTNVDTITATVPK